MDKSTSEGSQSNSATLPLTVDVQIHELDGYEDNVYRYFQQGLLAYLREVSRHIDLSGLDGATITTNQDKAIEGFLATLDEPSSRDHTSVYGETFSHAATAVVLKRGSELKSHLFFQFECISALLADNSTNESRAAAIYTLVHECAHVDVTSVFDRSFPNLILTRFDGWDRLDRARWVVAMGCWDEFAACYFSARAGTSPLNGYVQVFEETLDITASKHAALRQCENGDDIWQGAFDLYGTLMKLACYVLGTMRQQGLSVDDVPSLKQSLDGSWFAPFFRRLSETCDTIMDSYGEWRDKTAFESIGDLLQDVFAERGIRLERRVDGEGYIVGFYQS